MSINIYPKIDYTNRLNEQQHKIIKDAEGPCLVLAGAGSGKTRMLIYRVCYLLEQGIPASSVLLLTFTNKAAGEMVDRVKKSIGFYPEGLRAGTFHHAGNLILKEYGNTLDLPPNFTILDTEDSLSLLKEIANKISDAENLPHLAKMKEIISFSVNTEESIRDIVNTQFPQYSYSIHLIEKIVNKYQKKKKLLNSLDYDDLLFFWYRLMKNDSVGMKLASRFQYILVDEYHDTNKLQSLILYQMAKVHRNILVVGDDAQSIYSFRGATINNILEFPKVYADARIFYMDVNYRSTPEILDFANNIISHNRVQFPKGLVSVRKTGVKPVVVKCVDVKDESLFENAGINHIIEHEKLEADDCIAIYVKKLLEKQHNCKIYIITSDCDYLQINYENVFIYNLSYKLIEDNKLYTKNCIDDLLLKIIMGDKSDNIPPIFPRCGLKIAKKCIEDKHYFKSIMKDEKIKNQFEKNQKLIDFEMIPADLRESLLNKYKYIYE